MQVVNDRQCSWINDLNPRENIKELKDKKECDWLIIGAGYTGLSAARKLAELNKDHKIILVDSQLAGEGASGRNSGYLVDTTLNDGFTSNKEIENYKIKTNIYNLGIEAVKKFIKHYQVDCDWNTTGKYYASSKIKDKKVLLNFSKLLTRLGFDHNLLERDDLIKRLGTNFYNIAIYTKGGILLHPGKLVRAMIDTLPNNVELLENSSLLEWEKKIDSVNCIFKYGNIRAKKVIFSTNGFLKSLGIKSNYSFPLTLTASMTRSLNNSEFEEIGSPNEWGVLPVRPMGATIRMTRDRRILIRNTVEVYNPFYMSKSDLKKRLVIHLYGIRKRFPNLPKDIIQSTWSGIVSRTRNSSPVFEKINDQIFVAGCYNGAGIGIGTLFGEQIALKANNFYSKEIETIEKIKKPNLLPPNYFLNIGVRIRLMYERIKAFSEI
jgi:glycine/D-amino acid oxidase-like deaminating enzyme